MSPLALLLGLACSAVARADLYSANLAYEKQDLTRAFELFREIGELGHRDGQTNLAAMYVTGEGVKRDNIRGYAWALIAKENGSTLVQPIIDQLEPHMSESARKTVAGIQAEFGKEALRRKLLPDLAPPESYKDRVPCKLVKGEPGMYPVGARNRGVQGNLVVDIIVAPDGRARTPRVVYAVPPDEFEQSAINSVLRSKFKPAEVNGVAVPCNLSIAYRYVMPEYQSDDYPKLETFLQKTAVKAREGDPRAQTLYGLLIAGLPQFRMSRVDALPWFAQAAQAGMPLAQFTLGYSMLQGWGCNKEVEKGLFWLRKAAGVGQADAQVAIALHLAEGAATPEKTAEAFTLLEQAAAARSRDGRYYLAALLATSEDDKRRDPERAVALIGEIMRDVDSDPAAFEIRAAARAGQGKFAEAVKDQRKALQMAQKLSWNAQPQQLRLESYLRQRAWTGNLFAL